MRCLGVVVLVIAPAFDLGSVEICLCIGVGVIEPERNVNALYIVYVAVCSECLWQEAFLAEVLFKSVLCRFLIQLERDYYIGSLVACELSYHYYWASAIGAVGGSCGVVTDDLTAAGITKVDLLPFKLSLHPLVAGLA